MAQLEDATGVWWLEARDAAKHSTMHKTDTITKEIYCPKISIVLILRNPGTLVAKGIRVNFISKEGEK